MRYRAKDTGRRQRDILIAQLEALPVAGQGILSLGRTHLYAHKPDDTGLLFTSGIRYELVQAGRRVEPSPGAARDTAARSYHGEQSDTGGVDGQSTHKL